MGKFRVDWNWGTPLTKDEGCKYFNTLKEAVDFIHQEFKRECDDIYGIFDGAFIHNIIEEDNGTSCFLQGSSDTSAKYSWFAEVIFIRSN